MELKDVVYIAPDSPTGLRWKVTLGSRVQEGKVAGGNSHSSGYSRVRINDRLLFAHRVVAVLSGILDCIDSAYQVDHIDGNRANNKPSNLRAVSNRTNASNKVRHRAGSLVGCYYDKKARKWVARIQVDGIRICPGVFNTEQEAHEAYLRALPR